MRHGSEVEHASFDDLDEAVAAMRKRALEIRAEGPAEPSARCCATSSPRQQVHARLQLDRARAAAQAGGRGRRARRRHASSPTAAGCGREELDPSDHETPFDLVRETLEAKADERLADSRDPEGQLRRRAAGEAARRRRAAATPSSSTGSSSARAPTTTSRAGEIVFTRQIVKEKVGTGRWLAMYLGLFGTYRKDETIDLQFQPRRQDRAASPTSPVQAD